MKREWRKLNWDTMTDAERKEAHNDMVEALIFYANPDTWFATCLIGDPPCGDIAEDFDVPVVWGDDSQRPGAQARAVLLKHFGPPLDDDEIDEYTKFLESTS